VSRALATSAALVLGLGGALVGATPASAAGAFTVTTNLDDGLIGSLSYALANLDPVGGNTITITTTGPIVVPTALPVISEDVQIIGPAGGVTITTTPAAGSFVIVNATVKLQDIDVVPDISGTGTGITVTDSDLTLLRVSVNDFSLGVHSTDSDLTATSSSFTGDASAGILYTGSSATDNVTLTDVSAGGHSGAPTQTGLVLYAAGGLVSITNVTTAFTDTAGILLGNDGGPINIDTVTAEDSGVGIVLSGSSGSVMKGQHVRVSRAIEGFILDHLDHSELDLTDLQVTDSDDTGADLSAINGSRVTVTSATIANSQGYGVVLDASDSAIRFLNSTVHDSGLGAGCGCGGGSGVQIYADNSTVDVDGANVHDNTSDFGAGIAVAQAINASTITISNSTISHNHSSDDGGGIGVEQFGDDGTALTVSDSTISSNDAVDFGAGIYLHEIGGGVQSTAHVSILRTTVDDNHNSSGYGAGVAIDEPAAETSGLPTVLIDSSTISNNTTPAGGGGIYVGKFNDPSPAVVKVLNSTISGNTAQAGGAVYAETSTVGHPLLSTVISHSTLTNNSANTSGGVELNSGDQNLTVDNSIIADNNRSYDLQLGAPYTVTFSLIQSTDPSVVLSTADGNILGVNPQLATLAFNGGTTKTHLLSPSSPAYNAGNPAFAAPPATDQRGQARVFQRIDIGAVEWHPALALTGGGPRPETPLIGMLFLFVGLALVAASRIRSNA
jgi:hypothetical protein